MASYNGNTAMVIFAKAKHPDNVEIPNTINPDGSDAPFNPPQPNTPNIEEVSENHKDIFFGKVNVDKDVETTLTFVIPAFTICLAILSVIIVFVSTITSPVAGSITSSITNVVNFFMLSSPFKFIYTHLQIHKIYNLLITFFTATRAL